MTTSVEYPDEIKLRETTPRFCTGRKSSRSVLKITASGVWREGQVGANEISLASSPSSNTFTLRAGGKDNAHEEKKKEIHL